MKFLRLSALFLCFSSFSFAVNKDLVQLQRDLEDKLNAIQNDMDTKMANLTGMVSAMQADTRRTADQVATLENSLGSNVAKSLTPVAGLGAKVDSMNDDVRSVKDALADLSARLERMDAKITDLKNQMQILQNPPPAPAAAVPGSPLTTSPTVFRHLVLPQFNRRLRNCRWASAPTRAIAMHCAICKPARLIWPTTNFYKAVSYVLPQHRIGRQRAILHRRNDYNRTNFTGAVKAFDAVLEHYPPTRKPPTPTS